MSSLGLRNLAILSIAGQLTNEIIDNVIEELANK